MRKNKWLRRGVYFLVFLVILYLGSRIALFNPLEGSVPLLQALIPGDDDVEKGVTYCLHGPWEQIRKSPLFRKHFLESPMRSDLEKTTGLDQDLYKPIREIEEQINASLPSFLGEFSVLEDLAGKEVLLAGYLNGPGDDLSDRMLNSPFVALTRITFKAKFMEALKFEFVRSKVPGLRKRRNYYEYDLVEGANLDRPEEDRYRFFTRIKDVLILSNNEELMENVTRLGYAGGISEHCLAQQFYYYWDSRSPSPDNALTAWARVSKADGELGYRLAGTGEDQEGSVRDFLRTLFPVRRTVSVLLRMGTDGEDRIPLAGVVRLLENLKGDEHVEGLHRNEAAPLGKEVEACAAMFPERGTYAFSWLKMEPQMFFKSFFMCLDEDSRKLMFGDAGLPPSKDNNAWDLDTVARKLGEWFEPGVAVAMARLPESATIDLDTWEGGNRKPLPAITICLKVYEKLTKEQLTAFFTDNHERFGWKPPVEQPSPIGKLYELPLPIKDKMLALWKPGMAMFDNTFLFSTNIDELRRTLEVIKSGEGSLAKLPAFESAISSVAEEGNMFVFIDGDRLQPYLEDQRYEHARDASNFLASDYRKRMIIELTEEHDEWTNERIQNEATRRVEQREFTMKRTDFPEALKIYMSGLRFTRPFEWFAISTTSSGDTGGPRLELKGEIRLRSANGNGNGNGNGDGGGAAE